MAEIYFYSGAKDKLNVVCRLCAKAISQGARIMIFASDQNVLDKMDTLLWTYQQTSFLPHCLINDDEKLVELTPIVLGDRINSEQGYDILINLDIQSLQAIDQFKRVIEIAGVSQQDIQAARDRYRYYKQAGYTLHHHDLSKH